MTDPSAIKRKTSEPDRSEYTYDVFISYSSKDKDWVRGDLLARIERAGLKACIDYRDFRAGVPSTKECLRGAKESRRTLAVVTPSFFESGWTELERIKTTTLDPANRETSLIPLLRSGETLPEDIEHLTYVDFRDGEDLELAWRKLLTALGRPPEAEAPPTPQREGWHLAHPYPMPPHFTGRQQERDLLSAWLDEDAEHPVLSLRALGGFGKSALAWHWLTQDVYMSRWPRVVWWSFYEGDVQFDAFLESTVDYLSGGGIDARKVGPKNAVIELLKMLREPGTLLVLDGFERALRAFSGMNAPYQGDDEQETESEAAGRDCVSPIAEYFLKTLSTVPGFRSKVLLTTRLRPRVLDAKGGGLLTGAAEHELTQLTPEDAVAFFAAKGIRGTRAEIETACEAYGYHPLSLTLLAGLIINDLREPGDIAAAEHLDVSGDLIQNRNHVLKAAYESLPAPSRSLLSKIACFRWPVEYDTLVAIDREANTPTPNLESVLGDLVARGLLHHDREARDFDLHPIVRRYAYARLGEREQADAHEELRDYFENVPKPKKVVCTTDLSPMIELYHHTVKAKQFDEAFNLYQTRLSDTLFYQLADFRLMIELVMMLFRDGESAPPALRAPRDQVYVLNHLGLAAQLGGRPARAIPLYERCTAFETGHVAPDDLAVVFINLAFSEASMGLFQRTESSLNQSSKLAIASADKSRQLAVDIYLARLWVSLGYRERAEKELAATSHRAEELNLVQLQCLAWAIRAEGALHFSRTATGGERQPSRTALAAAKRALELADEIASIIYPHEREYVLCHWLLGAAHRVEEDHPAAEEHLHEALERCRRINLVELEGDILIDLARLRRETGKADEALILVSEARDIAERCGYVLQLADAYIELARLARDRGETELALEHARKAHEYATCDGPPDYTYKAAYVESEGLIKELDG